jgi:hypothetical protein
MARYCPHQRTGRPRTDCKECAADPKPKRKRKLDKEGRAHIRIGSLMSKILEDPSVLDDWTDEELLRGKKNGQGGMPSQLVPLSLHQELARRLFGEFNSMLRANVAQALAYKVLVSRGELEGDELRLKECTWMVERMYGKAPVSVDLNINALPEEEDMAPWQQAIRQDILRIASGDPQAAEDALRGRLKMDSRGCDGGADCHCDDHLGDTEYWGRGASGPGVTEPAHGRPKVTVHENGKRKGRRVSRPATQPPADDPSRYARDGDDE